MHYKFQAIDINDEYYKASVWTLLKLVDHEFVPPLSARNSSKQRKLDDHNTVSTEEPFAYLEAILKQNFLGVIEPDKSRLIGFMTYIEDFEIEELEGINPSTYVTTIIIEPTYRNNGLTTQLYNMLIDEVRLKGNNYISTRTWSTNKSHIHVLNNLGFKEIKVLENHRGAGVDTIYFALDTKRYFI